MGLRYRSSLKTANDRFCPAQVSDHQCLCCGGGGNTSGIAFPLHVCLRVCSCMYGLCYLYSRPEGQCSERVNEMVICVCGWGGGGVGGGEGGYSHPPSPPIEAALADKRSDRDSFIYPSSPPGLDRLLRAGQPLYSPASGLRPAGVAPWKSIKADERENEA